MRKLLLILLMLPLVGNAQLENSLYKHFIADANNQVIWQDVYNINSNANIYTSLLHQPFIQDVKLNGDIITFKLVDYKFSGSNISFLMLPICANGLIELKPGKYRITLSEITAMADHYRDNAFKNKSDNIDFTGLLIIKKKNAWRQKGFLGADIQTPINKLDDDFTNFFSLKQSSDNW